MPMDSSLRSDWQQARHSVILGARFRAQQANEPALAQFADAGALVRFMRGPGSRVEKDAVLRALLAWARTEPLGARIVLEASSTGAQTAPGTGSYQYDSYGSPIGTAPTTFGYKTAQIMPGGLVHFGARYESTVLGQWTQQDPASKLASLLQSNRFAFVGGDPVNHTDLGGTEILEDGAEFLEEVGQAATKEATGIPIPTRRQFSEASKCGEELGKKGDFEYEHGKYKHVQGDCDPFEYLPTGEVEAAE